MKTKHGLLTGILFAVAAAGLQLISGCGGGGGATAPVPQAGGSGTGQVAVRAIFPDMSAGREAGRTAGAASGMVTVTITVYGYELSSGQPFTPVTSVTQVSLSQGAGKAKVLSVPVGKNHLIVATADWGYAAATIKGLITEINDGAVKQAVIDSRTTAIADAAVLYASNYDSILPNLDPDMLPQIEQAVDDLSAAGVPYAVMADAAVLDYMENKTSITSASITLSPLSATVAPGAQQAFSATVYDTNQSAITSAIITWSISPATIGTIDGTGTFTAGPSAGTGTITASYGAITAATGVTVAAAGPAAPVCGNSAIETGESCDDGTANGTACTPSYGTGCAYCGATCQTTTVSPAAYCGDGVLNGSEACDDGNTASGDGCSATCQTEAPAAAVCGNSMVESGEACDDGNTVTETCAYGQTSCAVCDATCASVSGAASTCGDNVTNGSETCDDGNTTTEACAYGQTSCTVCGATCASVAGATSTCGDNSIDAGNGETCDDGGANTNTPCAAAYGGSCSYCNPACASQTVQGASCGDGSVDAGSGETCDDGNTTSDDGCSATCAPDTLLNGWITIPAGDFVMGCATADTGCGADESPKRTLTLSEYKIQKYEVTNAQYAACVAASACAAPSSFASYSRPSYYGNTAYDNYPVIFVDWNKSKTYCEWLGGRLPTEAEWEKAARGPSPREPIYPWGDTSPDCTLAAFNFNSCAGDTEMVGSHPAGASYYGVMDMTGNNWEWTNDWYGSTYYSSSPSTDPFGPLSGTYKMLRGGAWMDDVTLMSTSHRNGIIVPSGTYNRVGLRCVKDGPAIPVCGNGTTESGESCDDGNTTTEACAYGQTSCTVCDATCASTAGAASYCGDSTTDAGNGEACDDGNATTEACTYGQTSCTVCDASCASVAGATAYCGDGATNGGETCDDGNTTTETCTYGQTSCTVCDASCASAAGATAYCDDSVINGSETCDDGNASNGDGCSSACAVEIRRASNIAAAMEFTCILNASGGVKCMGWNGYGMVGDGTTTTRQTLVDVTGLTSGVAMISGSYFHTCAVTTAGGAKCWGWNGNNQLGDGTTTNRLSPYDVPGYTSGVAAIAAGMQHTCLLTTSGGVKCVGLNDKGQLGDGTTTNSTAWVDVTGLTSGVTDIESGRNHTCAVLTDGTMKCWGENMNYQLGDGTNVNRTTAVSVSGITGAVYTSVGSISCAILNTGAVKCWGYSDAIGNGTGGSSTPVSVTGLTASTIGFGDYHHVCAVTTAGGARCWGINYNGYLGDGTTTSSRVPVDVSGLTSGVKYITTSGNSSCAILNDDSLRCWGEQSTSNYKFGNCTGTTTLVPVAAQSTCP